MIIPNGSNAVYRESYFWCLFSEAACLQGDWASFAKLLYLSEQPWRKALTLGSVAGSQNFLNALCCISYSLICAKALVLPSALKRCISDWWNGAWGVGTANKSIWRSGHTGMLWVPACWLRTSFLIFLTSAFATTAHLPVQLFWRLWCWFPFVSHCGTQAGRL